METVTQSHSDIHFASRKTRSLRSQGKDHSAVTGGGLFLRLKIGEGIMHGNVDLMLQNTNVAKQEMLLLLLPPRKTSAPPSLNSFSDVPS